MKPWPVSRGSVQTLLAACCLCHAGFSAEPARTASLQVVAVLKDETAIAGAHDIEIRDGLAYIAGKGFTSRRFAKQRRLPL